MTHPFDRYFRKHSHYPRIRLDNGIQRILIEFAPGYVRVTTYPRGGEIYIVRSAWFSLLRRSIPIARKWTDNADFDVPDASHQSYLAEMTHLDDLRSGKRERRQLEGVDDLHRRERQRQRFLAARARRSRQEALEQTEDDD